MNSSILFFKWIFFLVIMVFVFKGFMIGVLYGLEKLCVFILVIILLLVVVIDVIVVFVLVVVVWW